MNYNQQDIPNNNQKEEQNRSEQIQSRSEDMRNHSEQDAEPFRTVPNNNQFVRNHSERIQQNTQNVPKNSSEQNRTASTCSENGTEHTITVREAARIFEEAGVPRTERALTNWCNLNNRGVTRLDCCYSEPQRRYYVTPQSIDEVIKEERKKALHRGQQNAALFSAEAENLSEQVQNETQNGSERNENRSEPFRRDSSTVPNQEDNVRNETLFTSEQSEESVHAEGVKNNTDNKQQETLDKNEKDALKDLQMENYELKVQLEGQKYLIRKFDELVDGERERHEKEKLALVDRLTDARHQVGSLEEKLLQLEAPKGVVREAEASPATSVHTGTH